MSRRSILFATECADLLMADDLIRRYTFNETDLPIIGQHQRIILDADEKPYLRLLK